jgi:hypothetical protein
MQAVAEQLRSFPKVIIFPGNMSQSRRKKNIPPPPEPLTWWQQHSNKAPWASVIVVVLGIVLTNGLTLYFHFSAGQSAVSDEHTGRLIGNELDPAIHNVNENFDKRLAETNHRIEELASKVDDALGQLKRMHLEVNPQAQKTLLSSIRREIKTAEDGKQALPAAKLADYKMQVRQTPKTVGEYWMTVAAIVNYQSFLNQMNGHAPDPAAVSRPCSTGITSLGPGTSFNNTYEGMDLSRCIVDLDTETFKDVTFRDSVIRYRGARVSLSNVRFINCRFVLDIPVSTPANPQRDRLLMTLLDSSDTESVTISSTHS